MNAEARPILSIRNLRIAFPGGAKPAVAVDNLSLDLYPGQVTALIGESGSGKSATILAILGLLPAGTLVSGEIDLGQGSISFADEKALEALRGRVVGTVFQDPLASLNPVLSIGEQIDEVFQAHRGLSWRQAREKSVELMGHVGLPDPQARAKDYAHQLSGGQRQRAAIAMALAGRPIVLLADEPTSALDPTVQAQILDLLLALVEEGTALLLVTHDLAFAAEAADRIAVIYAGRIVEHGPVAAVTRDPIHPYTQALLAASLPFGEFGGRRAARNPRPHAGTRRDIAGLRLRPALFLCARDLPPSPAAGDRCGGA